MKKPLVAGILGVLVGLGLGAVAMRWFDSRSSDGGAADSSKQPGHSQALGSVTDPVLKALDSNKLFKAIISPKSGTEFEHQIADFGPNHEVGYAVWHAEPLDEKALRERVLSAINAAVAAGGARPVSEKDFTIATIAVGGHKLHYFYCSYFYRAKPGDQYERVGQATVWVTAPREGMQYSAGYRFGK